MVDRYKIGVRTQDIHNSLRDVQVAGPVIEYKNTLLMGKVATLSTHLRGQNVIPYNIAFERMAGELGINPFELDCVLTELQEISFIRVIGNKGSTEKRIELTIPELRNIYDDIGEQWKNLRPSEIEQKTLEIIEDIAYSPKSKEIICGKYSLNEYEYSAMLDVGNSGAFLSVFTAEDGQKVIYSPLHTEENPEKLYEFLKKYPDGEISKIVRSIERLQGIPEKYLNNKIVEDAQITGVLLPTTVSSTGGTEKFLFTPFRGCSSDEKVIIDKARALLSCVRYGENFATITRIRSPKALLNALKDRGELGAHSEINEQYGMLVSKAMGIIEPSKHYRGRYIFKFLDTDENLKALDLALGLLEDGDIARVHSSDALSLQQAGQYFGVATTRSKLTREVRRSKTVDNHVIGEISKILRGVE